MAFRWPRLGVRRRWVIVAAVPIVLVLLLVVADRLLDEPLRRQLERRMNDRLHGYTVALGALDVHLFGLTVDLKDVVVTQQSRPDPPVARLARLVASVQWRELLHGKLVANFRFEQPWVYVDLEHVRQEARDPEPVKDKGWQDALQEVHPFKINEVTIVDGTITYDDKAPTPPLELTHVNAAIGNIRNIRAKEHTYPSTLTVDAVVFDRGRLHLEGNADFLAEPHLGVRADVRLEGMNLEYFKPIAGRYNVAMSGGTLATAGTLEYAPDGSTMVHLADLTLEGAKIDYVHKASTKAKEEQVAQKTKEKAKEVTNAPDVLVRVDHAHIGSSTFGFVDQAAKPPYRVFVSDTRLELTNLTNRFTEGTAVAKLHGRFMGSGALVADANFRPENEGPDFDIAVKLDDTDMKTMNDLLRAYGKFDVVRGLFSFYSELTVRKGDVTGYVKPLFRDMQVYDKRQDAEKSTFRKLYEKLVGGVAALLKNRPREEVATKAEVKGRLDDPKANTWQVIVRLIENAFFRAILPGFDEELGSNRGVTARASSG
jgi:hypothetical protein